MLNKRKFLEFALPDLNSVITFLTLIKTLIECEKPLPTTMIDAKLDYVNLHLEIERLNNFCNPGCSSYLACSLRLCRIELRQV